MIIAFEKHFQVCRFIFLEGAERSGPELKRLGPSQEAFGTLQDYKNNA